MGLGRSCCSAALLYVLRVSGIVVGVVMGHNRCIGVVKGVWGDRKCPMASGTICEVEYRVDEDWRLLDDSVGSLILFLTDKMTETKPENLEMIDQSQPVVLFWKYKSPVNILDSFKLRPIVFPHYFPSHSFHIHMSQQP